MKQVIQSRKSGKLALKEVPAPIVKAAHLLVETRASLISVGTERMVIDFAKKGILSKARARPDLVKQVIDKAKRDGFRTTFESVMARLYEPLPLGYSASGVVKAVGAGLEGDFSVGERVAMSGAGIANHAEQNVVPRNLVARVPEGVSDEAAAFGTIGAIALHAVRNAKTAIGEVVAVLGCGLIGQMAMRLLTLSGCRVVALDYNLERLKLASALGAEWALDLSKGGVEEIIREMTAGRGADAVIITAATESSEPFEHAASMARDRASVVMVGMTGTAFPYAEFMKKELKIVISRSYGPGRYDDDFETRGVKYPVGWVRWTETDNLVEILRLMQPNQEPQLDISSLITHRFSFEEAETAYSLVTSESEHLGVLLTYTGYKGDLTFPTITPSCNQIRNCVIGVIGAGNYARTILLPKLKRISGVSFGTLVTERGFTAEYGQEHFGFLQAASDTTAVMENDGINAVVIATRHNSHAELASQALKAGKAVWVEKPLALDFDELNAVIEARNSVLEDSGAFLQIGFNRRFAPATEHLRAALARKAGPKVLAIRVNAGAIAAGHWVHSLDTGGGRLVGEACHFVDLARALMGVAISRVDAQAAVNTDGACDDAAVSLSFADGSLASIVYTARGDATSGKERIEAHAGGSSYLIDDFREFTASGDATVSEWKGSQDKGYDRALQAFVNAVVNGGPAPIDEKELIETSSATLAVMESLRSGQVVELN